MLLGDHSRIEVQIMNNDHFDIGRRSISRLAVVGQWYARVGFAREAVPLLQICPRRMRVSFLNDQ